MYTHTIIVKNNLWGKKENKEKGKKSTDVD
jgi:hypothetical protein